MKEEITLLQEKNRHRKALLKHYKQIHEKDLKEIERLNNIIDKAIKYMEAFIGGVDYDEVMAILKGSDCNG